MGTETRYVIRGKLGDRQYKVVKGVIRKVGEVRGEDNHESIYDAIYHTAQALKKWQYCPEGIRFDAHPVSVEVEPE